MATVAQRQDTRNHRVPWSPSAWRQALYLAGGIPAQVAAPLLVAAGFLTKPRWALPLLFLVVVFLAVPVLTAIERYRLRATAGIEIPLQPAIEHRSTKAGILSYARSPATWRQLGYHLLAAPVAAAAAAAAFAAWLAGICGTLVYAYAWDLPGPSLLSHGQSSPPAHLHRLFVPVDVWLTVAGIALLAVAPWLTATVGALDARAARVLLGPSRAEELQHRVDHLTQTRTGAVDAADAERRRLGALDEGPHLPIDSRSPPEDVLPISVP